VPSELPESHRCRHQTPEAQDGKRTEMRPQGLARESYPSQGLQERRQWQQTAKLLHMAWQGTQWEPDIAKKHAQPEHGIAHYLGGAHVVHGGSQRITFGVRR
jgi:hypothetical protein